MGRVIRTTKSQIAEYWIKNNNISELELNFDWSEANTHCWNCGDDRHGKLERCHIIPDSLGGSDSPDNYVLLCKSCHEEAPNINNSNDMWCWIKSNYMPLSFYGTYKIRKALIMFKQTEGYSFFDKALTIKDFDKVIKEELKNISTHGVKFNISTYYYMLKNIINNNK
jgi:Zn finger protein HypA/HybF involved in hydrogenase expression